MTQSKFFKLRMIVTAAITLFVWTLLVWDYTHGGVPTHHLLARKDLPSFSNWWGGLLLPLLSWYLTYRVQKRVVVTKQTSFSTAAYTFIGAMVYGLLLSLAFMFNMGDVPFYLLVSVLLFSGGFPIYRSEFFLGLAVGMTFAFGGVLPIIVVSVVSLIGLAAYKLVRPGLLWGYRKVAG